MPKFRKRKLHRKSTSASKRNKVSYLDETRNRKLENKDFNEDRTKADGMFETRSGRQTSRKSTVNYDEQSSNDDLSSNSDSTCDPVWEADDIKRNLRKGRGSIEVSSSEGEESAYEKSKNVKPRKRGPSVISMLPEKRTDIRSWNKLSESSDNSDEEVKNPQRSIRKVVNCVTHLHSLNFSNPQKTNSDNPKFFVSDGSSPEFRLNAAGKSNNEGNESVLNSDAEEEKRPRVCVGKRERNRRQMNSKSRVTRKQNDVKIKSRTSPVKKNSKRRAKFESSEESDWEEVGESKDIDSYNPVIPHDGVDIMLALPKELQKKAKHRRSNAELFRDYCRMVLRRIIKENHFNLHKTNLLCLLGYSFHITELSASPLIKALLMSVVPKNIQDITPKSFKLETIDKILAWFHGEFCISYANDVGTSESLFRSFFATRKGSPCMLVFVFAALMWHLGVECRIVFSYNPVPIKNFKYVDNPFRLGNFDMLRNESGTTSLENRHLVPFKGSKKVTTPKTKKKIKYSDVANLSVVPERRARVIFNGSSAESDDANKKTKSRGNKTDSSVRKSSRKKSVKQIVDCEDSDFEEVTFFKKSERRTLKRSTNEVKHGPVDEWLEIYLNSAKKWVCVDCINDLIDKEDRMEENCSGAVSYVLAFTKDRKLKDVTERYASGWLNTTPKIRVDWFCGPDWWEETLRPYMTKGNKVEAENKQLQEKALNLPLPKSIAEFRHHKLYALGRHLLKFESVYPPDAPALGFIRGEAVYARECVRTLFSRDHWVQQARTVRTGETPYKIVKARPSFRKRENDENRMLELFGQWQTEPYDPPSAVNGKIPRNAFGNVELFKPEMLPKGTRYLMDMPGLSRIARKLNIDCAQAMVGWEFRKGRNVPMLDGWIVCEEHVDIFQAAWDEEQVNIMKREQEKRDKRIYGNWRKLIKGMLIKKKLELRYGTGKDA